MEPNKLTVLEELKEFISKHEWINAKTYEKTAPHEYLALSKMSESERHLFVKFGKYIRSDGYEKLFWGKSYKYIDIDGYKYWTMDFNVEETDLVNREPLK